MEFGHFYTKIRIPDIFCLFGTLDDLSLNQQNLYDAIIIILVFFSFSADIIFEGGKVSPQIRSIRNCKTFSLLRVSNQNQIIEVQT